MSDEKAVKEVTFIGYGLIWDQKTGKEICQFSGAQRDARPPRPGKLTTSDPALIKRLKDLGYKIARESEDENE